MLAIQNSFEQALNAFDSPNIIGPSRQDYRLRRDDQSLLAMEVDLRTASDECIEIVVPVPSDETRIDATIATALSRLEVVLSDRGTLLPLRAAVEQAAVDLFTPGVRGRVVEVRLSPIDLTEMRPSRAIQVLVEGEANEMLRPFVDVWQVDGIDDLDDEFAWFDDQYRMLGDLRAEADALGAIGFIDPCALALAKACSDGLQHVLARTVSEDRQVLTFPRRCHADPIELYWQDGIVVAGGYLTNHVWLTGQELRVEGIRIDPEAVGGVIGHIVDLPYLDSFQVASVGNTGGTSRITLSGRTVPFDGEGEIVEPR